MTLKEALKRIEALEHEVALLKAAPKQEFHYHYPPQQPGYWWNQPVVWGGAGNVGAGDGEVVWTDGLGNTGTYKMGAS